MPTVSPRSGALVLKQLVAVLDDRTTVICLAAAGQIQPVDEPYRTVAGDFDRPPFHVHCRSISVPWTAGMVDDQRRRANAEILRRPDRQRAATDGRTAYRHPPRPDPGRGPGPGWVRPRQPAPTRPGGAAARPARSPRTARGATPRGDRPAGYPDGWTRPTWADDDMDAAMARIEARSGRPFARGASRRRQGQDADDMAIVGRAVHREYLRRAGDTVDARTRRRIQDVFGELDSIDEELSRNAARVRDLQNELARLTDQLGSTAQIVGDNLRVLGDVVGEVRPTGIRATIRASGSTDEARQLEAMLDDVAGALPRDWIDGRLTVDAAVRSGRAYARGRPGSLNAEITVSSATDLGTAAHEFAHTVQFNNDALFSAEQHYLRRVAGVPTGPLPTDQLGAGFRTDELRVVAGSADLGATWVPHPYVAKLYPERQHATEVSSMILQNIVDHGADVTGVSTAWAAPREWFLGALAVL